MTAVVSLLFAQESFAAEEVGQKEPAEEEHSALVEQEEAKLAALRHEAAEARRALAEHDGGSALDFITSLILPLLGWPRATGPRCSC